MLTRDEILSGKPDAVDSYGAPNPAALAAAGVKLACRYLSPPPNPKNVTRAEIAALHAAGIGVLLNWESDPQRSLDGSGAGTVDGAQAGALASALGAPEGTIIYFSSDFDTNPGQYPTIGGYYIAASDALPTIYNAGGYGEGALVDYLIDWGDIAAGWQTYAWSGDYISPNAALYQYLIQQTLPGVGVGVDLNRILNPTALGAWWAPGHEPAPAPAPSTGDDDMLPEFIRNSTTNGVIASLGGSVMKAVDYTTWVIWNDLHRPVTTLQDGPWQHYTNFLAAGNTANIAAIAQATAEAIANEVGTS